MVLTTSGSAGPAKYRFRILALFETQFRSSSAAPGAKAVSEACHVNHRRGRTIVHEPGVDCDVQHENCVHDAIHPPQRMGGWQIRSHDPNLKRGDDARENQRCGHDKVPAHPMEPMGVGSGMFGSTRARPSLGRAIYGCGSRCAYHDRMNPPRGSTTPVRAWRLVLPLPRLSSLRTVASNCFGSALLTVTVDSLPPLATSLIDTACQVTQRGSFSPPSPRASGQALRSHPCFVLVPWRQLVAYALREGSAFFSQRGGVA